jgi:ATP-dependent Zn protease
MHSLSYEEFVELLQEKKSIAKIIMNKYTLGSHHMYEAEVVDIQGNHHLLPVGNADNFIENLERVQLEEMGTPIDNLIQIDLAYPSKNKTWLNVMNDVLSLGLGFLILLSVLKGGSGVNSGIFGAAKKIKKFGVDTKVSVKFKDVAG